MTFTNTVAVVFSVFVIACVVLTVTPEKGRRRDAWLKNEQQMRDWFNSPRMLAAKADAVKKFRESAPKPTEKETECVQLLDLCP